MKNTITIILILLSFNVLSQVKFSSYQQKVNNLYKPIKNFDINILINKDNKFTLYINAVPYGITEELTKGFLVHDYEYNNFIVSLNSAKKKYEEWLMIAKENNVNSFVNKEMNIICKMGAYYKNTNFSPQYVCQDVVYPKFSFIVREKPEYILSISISEIVDPYLNDVKFEGAYIDFYSINEINDFINKISLDKINKFINTYNNRYNNNNKYDHLFKD